MAFNTGAILTLKDNFTSTLKGIKQGNQSFRRDIQNTRRDLDSTFDKKRQFKIDTSLAKSAISSLHNSVLGLAGAIGAGAAVYGIGKLSLASLKLASDAEQASIAFTTMLGSPDKATKFLADMTKFANKTPFELPEVRDAAKKMLAFGFASESVIPMLTGVGNASAGLGLGKEGIDRITLALGQMKAKAKVQGGEMMQLTEAGIPAWQMLAEKMHISTAEVMKMSEKGLIPADKAIQTLIEGMNKRFPDMMAKQSKSLAGLWSTMKDTFNNSIFIKWGEGIASALKPRFEKITLWIDQNGSTIERWGQNLQAVVSRVTDGIASKFESAFTYVKAHFLNNPEFTSIPDISGKVTFIIDDLLATYNAWYTASGSTMIKSATDNLVSVIAVSISDNAAKLVEPALKLGATLANGIEQGLQKSLADHPLMSMFIGGAAGSKFGAIGAAAGFVGGGVASFEAQRKETAAGRSKVSVEEQKFIDESIQVINDYKARQSPMSTSNKSNSPLSDTGGAIFHIPRIDGSHANGLSNVPKDGYIANLHKNERVLTASENKNYTSNTKKSDVTINIYAENKSITQIVAELVPQLKLHIANA